MTDKYPTLTISGELDGVQTTGVFEMTSADVEPFIRTGEFFQSGDGVFQTGRAIAFESRRDEVKIDGGAGVAGLRIDFDGWEGSDAQWGSSAAAGLSRTSATGQSPIQQISVLFHYLIESNIDSTNPAKLEWGEFSDAGLYDPLQVAPEEPTLPKSREESSSFSGSITFVSVSDLSNSLGRVESPS